MANNAVITYSELIKDDGAFKKLEKDFDKLSINLVKRAAQLRKDLKLVNANEGEKIRKLAGETEKLIIAEERLERTAKALAIAKERLRRQTEKNTQATLDEREAMRKSLAESRLVAKIKNTQSGTIENLRAKLSLVTVAWTKLTNAEIENTNRGRRVVASKKLLTEELKRLEKATGDNRRNVGNYSSALQNLRRTLIQVANAGGVFFGVLGAVRVLRNSVTLIRTYGKENATLNAVLQTTTEETADLREEQLRLGESTVKTSVNVTSLQVSLARLGFTQSEIIDLTESIIVGSIALNGELAKTAQLTGAVVKTFNEFSTTDAPEIIDAMALATAKSALNFGKLEVALPIVGGAANEAGINFTTLLALLGKLADSGIDVSSSATSLRNIFIDSAKQGLNFGEILEKIKGSQDRLTAANDEFGRRTAVSASILSRNIDAVQELDESLQDAAGTAEEMARKELNTLDGAIKLIISAWEGYILRTDEANNIGQRLQIGIKFLAENLTLILNALGIAIQAWLLYRGAIIATNLVIKAYTLQQTLAAAATGNFTFGIRRAIVALRTMNTVAKANIIGLLATAIFVVVEAFDLLNDQVDDFQDKMTLAEEIQKEVTESTRKEVVELNKLVGLIEVTASNTEERAVFVKQLNDEYGTTLDNTKSEKDLLIDLNVEYDKLIKNIIRRGQAEAVNRKLSTLQDDRLRLSETIRQAVLDVEDETKRFAEEFQDTTAEGFSIAQPILDELLRQLEGVDKEIKTLTDDFLNLNDQTLDPTGGGDTDEKRRRNFKSLSEERFNRERQAQIDLLLLFASTSEERLEVLRRQYALDIELFEGTESEKLIITKLFEDERLRIATEAAEQKAKEDVENFEKEKKEREKRDKDILDQKKKLNEELKDLSQDLSGEIIASLADTATKEVEAANNAIRESEGAVEAQRKRAIEGLNNTLSEEKKLLAEREKEKIAAEKRLARIEKTRALYSAYASYSSDDPQTALGKALRDFAIIEGITASFAEGGYTGDGQKYENAGGVHKSEFVLDKATTASMGLRNKSMKDFNKDYSLFNDFLNNRVVNADTFGNQLQSYNVVIEAGLRDEMVRVRKSIENIPQNETSAPEIVNGMMQIIQKSKVGNRTKVKIYRTVKPKL